MDEPRLILFVCTGNLCRSPMAAGLLRARLEQDGLSGAYAVVSAGTWAVAGEAAAAYAQQVMAWRGIDLRGHRAQEITPELVEAARLILVMTQAHREALLAEFPAAASKLYLLSEMIGKVYDIADPYGSDAAHYDHCAADLEAIIDQGYERILALAGE